MACLSASSMSTDISRLQSCKQVSAQNLRRQCSSMGTYAFPGQPSVSLGRLRSNQLVDQIFKPVTTPILAFTSRSRRLASLLQRWWCEVIAPSWRSWRWLRLRLTGSRRGSWRKGRDGGRTRGSGRDGLPSRQRGRSGLEQGSRRCARCAIRARRQSIAKAARLSRTVQLLVVVTSLRLWSP